MNRPECYHLEKVKASNRLIIKRFINCRGKLAQGSRRYTYGRFRIRCLGAAAISACARPCGSEAASYPAFRNWTAIS